METAQNMAGLNRLIPAPFSFITISTVDINIYTNITNPMQIRSDS